MSTSLSHHEYARLFPMLSDESIQELADDIAKNGLRQPIVIDADEKILDGRNRAAACAIAQVKPVYEPFVGTDEEKLNFVVSVNVHRRHLSTSQRANIAATLLPIYEKLAAKRKERKPKSVPENLPEQKKGDARDQAGAAMNVSGKAVDMAAKVQAKAIPEIVDAVASGELAVSAAAVVADMPEKMQRKIVESGGAQAVRKAASEARTEFEYAKAIERLNRAVRSELDKWPDDHRAEAVAWVRTILEEYDV